MMYYPKISRVVLLAVGLVGLRAGLTQAESVQPRAADSMPASTEATTVLKVALADEGFRFVETGEVFAAGASDPALVQLPGGELLAVFACRQSRQGQA